MGAAATPGTVAGLTRAARGVADHAADDWPRTTRVLPWTVAGFITMLWLVPFDAIEITEIPGPVDLKLDRVVLLVVGLLWITSLGLGGQLAPRFRRSPMNWALLAFLLVAAAGVVANHTTLATQNELTLAVKKLALLGSFAVLYMLVTSVVRPSEVPNLLLLMLGLACVTAVGVLIEYRTGFNAFYKAGAALFASPFTTYPEAADIAFGRPSVTGPTLHGIAAATMLGTMVPFAVVGILRTTGGWRWLYVGAVAVLLMGALATQRKTGLVVPAASLATLLLYRPRAMLRLLPAGIVVVLIVMGLAGSAAVGVKAQFVGPNLNSDSTMGRTTDYDATAPDIFRYPLLGRGHGTYDPFKYRFLDNEYLHRTIETGFLGLAAYLALIATAMAVAHRVARVLGPVRGTAGMAAVAGIAAFAVCGAVFDVVSYPQPMYLFLLIAALCVCLRDGARA